MENRNQKGENTSSTKPDEPSKSRMKKPPIYTTEYGTQYVRVDDIIHSEDGWREIERLRNANLVQKPAPRERDTGKLSSTKDTDVT